MFKPLTAIVFFLALEYLEVANCQALKPKNIIIEQPNAPAKIVYYDAEYQEGSSVFREGIRHILDYQNTSSRTVVAVQITVVAFDVWNEYLSKRHGTEIETLKPGDKERAAWSGPMLGDYSFHTGVSYVSKVRFDNGEIWQVDLNTIVTELKKIEADFDVSTLKKKDSEN